MASSTKPKKEKEGTRHSNPTATRNCKNVFHSLKPHTLEAIVIDANKLMSTSVSLYSLLMKENNDSLNLYQNQIQRFDPLFD